VREERRYGLAWNMEGMGWQKKLQKFIGGGWYGSPYLAATLALSGRGQPEFYGRPRVSSRLVSCPRGSFSENLYWGRMDDHREAVPCQRVYTSPPKTVKQRWGLDTCRHLEIG
jgi:hypothetical protein